MYAHDLFIDNRCDGCGKCATDYPAIFSMAAGKAVVQPTINLRLPKNESDASFAIQKCRDSVGNGGYGGIGAIWGRGEGELPGHIH